MRRPSLLTAASAAMFLLAGMAGLAAQGPREVFTGMVARMSGPAVGPATGSLQITITRWTTPEERKALAAALVEKGQRGLLSALEDQKETGRASYPGTLGWRISYAWQFEQDGKRVVRLLTDRPIFFVEAAGNTRTMDYPFGIVEIQLDALGKGEGIVYSAASMKVNKDGVLEIESYGIGPQRYLSVTSKIDKD